MLTEFLGTIQHDLCSHHQTYVQFGTRTERHSAAVQRAMSAKSFAGASDHPFRCLHASYIGMTGLSALLAM